MQQPLIEPSTTSSSDEPTLALVQREDLEKVWKLAAPFIQRALPRAAGRLNLNDCEIGCMKGAFQLWLVVMGEEVMGAGLTEVIEYPRKRVFSVFLYSGERRRVMKLWPNIEAVARAVDCDEVQIAGPRAWQRIFPDYNEAFTVFTKAVR